MVLAASGVSDRICLSVESVETDRSQTDTAQQGTVAEHDGRCT